MYPVTYVTQNNEQTTRNAIINLTKESASNKEQRKNSWKEQDMHFFWQSVYNMFALQVVFCHVYFSAPQKSLQAMAVSCHIVALLFDTPIGYLILAEMPLILYLDNNACGCMFNTKC